jgi:hypothetical protein
LIPFPKKIEEMELKIDISECECHPFYPPPLYPPPLYPQEEGKEEEGKEEEGKKGMYTGTLEKRLASPSCISPLRKAYGGTRCTVSVVPFGELERGGQGTPSNWKFRKF